MNNNLKQKLRFFRACLEAEHRAQIVWNFPTRESKFIVAVKSIWSDIKLPEVEYRNIDRTLEVYTREKYLLLSHLFIQGRYPVPGFSVGAKNKAIKCPMFLIPCGFHSEERLIKKRVEIEFDSAVINPAIAQILNHYNIDLATYLEPLLDSFTRKRKLSNEAAHLNELAQVIQTVTENKLKLVMSSMVSVEAKRASAQSSLYELENLIEKEGSFSAPLRSVLREDDELNYHVDESKTKSVSRFKKFFGRSKPTEKQIRLPEILSDSQSAVLEVASKYPISVVAGPPGTGKSFTIACLALTEFSKGRSVLVVSQNLHAVGVVRRKLIDTMGVDENLTVMGGERQVAVEAKQQIKLMLGNR